MQDSFSFSSNEDPMQVSPPFSPDEGAIRTFPSHSSAHTLPSHSSVSTIPDGLVLTASFSDEESLLARGLDNDINWTWLETDKANWTVVTGGCQKFYDHWRGGSNQSKFLQEFPYPLSLGMDRRAKPFFPIPYQSGSQILVTESYERMFHHLLLLRRDDEGSRKGAVITGQPGIGKTTFLMFLLVRLLSLDQPVLLRSIDTALLFYHGTVYSRPAEDAFKNLPGVQDDLPEDEEYFPVWALIDEGSKDGPAISRSMNIWPIQASSPLPDRYKSWRKKTGASLLGMPLWNMTELNKGLLLVPEYKTFRRRLEHCLRTSKSSTDTGVNAALGVLRTEEAREKMLAEYGTCDGVNTSRGGEENVISEEDRLVKAFETLVGDATEEVGFAPRDVYRCVFLPNATKAKHASKVKQLTYLELQDCVHAFNADGAFDKVSHFVVAVWPCKLGVHHADWEISFKSNRIAKMVATAMRSAEDEHLRQTYRLLHKTPASASMAGRFFEGFAHRMFSITGKSSKQQPQPTLMISDGLSPPTFSTNSSSSPPPHPPPSPIPTSNRTVTYVDLPDDLSQVTLSQDKYYIPIASGNPLFDSFTINYNPDNHTVVLSIFQMTTSQKHGGSGKGYAYIQRVMTHIHELLDDKDLTATVKVTYFLVCPEGPQKRRGEEKFKNYWTMPLGWVAKGTRSSNPKRDMHRGDVFCIRFPGFDYIEDNNTQAS